MAAQGIWSGTVSFSLVAIPVRLVKAVAPGRVSFRLLHSTDYSPLARKMVCPKDEAPVPPDEIVRGFEITPDKYVLMSDEELESLSPERSRSIEIVEFVDQRDVDPIYYDRPYYLVPLKGGEKAYQLLVEVMQRTRKAGLAKFVLTEREHLALVASKGNALALITLHYPDEVLSSDDITPKREKSEADEESRMKKSIERMIEDFNPAKYANERREKIMRLLEARAKEKALVEAPAVEEEEGEGPPDLVAALEESMRKVKEGR
ncbi:MAG TPA: Ku protein [Nitrospirota bacterium]